MLNNAILKKRQNASFDGYMENNLLTDEVLEIIAEQHSLSIEKTYKNDYIYFNGRHIEFDVLIKAITPTGQIRWISIELKDSGFSKVIEQAMIRRPFVDYAYIISASSIDSIVQYILYVCPEYITENKLGIFSKNDLVLTSKYMNAKINIILGETTKELNENKET